MRKQTKKQAGIDYSKAIGGGLIAVGLVIIALLVAILVKTLRDEKKYTISYRSNDKLAEQMVEQSGLGVNEVVDEDIVIDAEKYITIERALDIALSNVGASRGSVLDIDVELDYKFGQVVYEVSFDYDQYEYEYYINAESGEIVKSFKELD